MNKTLGINVTQEQNETYTEKQCWKQLEVDEKQK